jgi:hypothetical protein
MPLRCSPKRTHRLPSGIPCSSRPSGLDPDGDVLTYRVVVQMSWHEIVYGPWPLTTIDEGTGLFRFIPQDFDVPGRRC